MARDDAPPFARGETYFNGGTIDTSNLSSIGGENLEGKEYVFEPNSQDNMAVYPAPSEPDGRPIRVKVVRNLSGVNLKGARLGHYQTADVSIAPYGCRLDGYCYQLGDRPAGIIDEFLPAAGVPPYDLFYIVIDGPTKATNQSASPITTAVESRLVPAATGSGRTDDLAGRVALQDLTGATATLGNNIQNCIGFAAVVDSGANDKFAVVIDDLD